MGKPLEKPSEMFEFCGSMDSAIRSPSLRLIPAEIKTHDQQTNIYQHVSHDILAFIGQICSHSFFTAAQTYDGLTFDLVNLTQHI
jgi:hypothetical protein